LVVWFVVGLMGGLFGCVGAEVGWVGAQIVWWVGGWWVGEWVVGWDGVIDAIWTMLPRLLKSK
jgi:hypothetical protein